jgi:hypothetical protein
MDDSPSDEEHLSTLTQEFPNAALEFFGSQLLVILARDLDGAMIEV